MKLNVVNCFQFRIFALWFTILCKRECVQICCELLSISYLCIMIYNKLAALFKAPTVVNCFQFRIFALWFTILPNLDVNVFPLWIAFNFVSLHYDLQCFYISKISRSRCELLSISYLCIMIYNRSKLFFRLDLVVNCFQFRIFALWFTIEIYFIVYFNVLWIAFNFVSLHYDLQCRILCFCARSSCELLSISYLCIMIYNVSAYFSSS